MSKENLKKALRADYVGTIHNTEGQRPMIGIHCRPAGKETPQVYELVNILTNGGRYDTYVLKNVKTGKMKKAKAITRLTKSNPRQHTKAEILAMVKEQPWKTARVFLERLAKVEENPDDIETWRALLKDALCTNHEDKMVDMISLSTSCLISCGDNKMRDNRDLICSVCFSVNLQLMKQTTRDKLIRNTLLLAFYDIPQEAFTGLLKPDVEIFRLESFGDLMNSVQFGNYLKLVRANPRVTFAEWTKKPWIMAHTFKTENKPENLIVIISAPRLNDTITIDKVKSDWPFADKVFTVYTKDYITENGVEINCGALKCFTCRKCYEHNGITELKEQVK